MRVEQLEERLAPAIVSWAVDTDGFWDDPANWRDEMDVQRVPGPADDVVISRGSVDPVVTIRTGVQSVGSLSSDEAIAITGGLDFAVSGTFANSGTLILGDGSDLSASSSITNSGTIRKVDAGAATLNSPTITDTGGTIEAEAGALTFPGTTVHFNDTTFAADAGATIDLSGTNRMLVGTITGTGLGTVQFASGTIFGDNVGSRNTTLDFAPNLFQWIGGNIRHTSFSSSGRTMTNVGTIHLAGAADKMLQGGSGSFINAGSIVHGGTGNLSLGLFSVLSNQSGAVYDFQNDGGWGTGTGVFNNAGTLRKSMGSGTSTLSSEPTLNDTGGRIEVQSGTLAIACALFDALNTTFVSDANTVLNLNGTTRRFAGLITGTGAGTVSFSSGTIFGDSVGSQTTTLNFAPSLFQWSGGIIRPANTNAFPRTITNVGTITLAGAAEKVLTGVGGGAGLFNSGVIRHTGTGNLNVATFALLSNQAGGVYDLQTDAGLIGSGTIENAGTFQKSAGMGTSTLGSSTTFNDTNGRIEVQTGTLALASGIFRATDTLFVSNANTVLDISGTSRRFAGSLVGQGNGTLLFDSGTLTAGDNTVVGQNAFTLNFLPGFFHWTGGTINIGARTATNAGTIQISGANDKVMSNGVFRNTGNVIHAGTGNLTLNLDFQNLVTGTYDIRGDVGPNSGSIFRNFGTFRKSAGVGVSIVAIPFAHLGGTVDVQTGTLSISTPNDVSSTGGNWSIAAGAVLDLSSSNPGGSVLSGDYAATGSGTVVLTTGTLFAVNDLTFNFNGPEFVWTGGDISAFFGGVFTFSGTWVIEGNAVKRYRQSQARNAGTILHRDGGNLEFAAVTFHILPSGVYEFHSDADITQLSSDPNTVVNEGILRKAAGSGTTSFSSAVALDNTGLVEVSSGTLALTGVTQHTGSTLAAGSWLVHDQSTLLFTTGQNIVTNNATVTLDGPTSAFAKINTLATNGGTFSVLNGRDFTTAAALSNTGTVAVGVDSDLQVTGNYAQTSSGRLTAQLGGDAASGLFGELTGNQTVTLAGTLRAELANGFRPAAGESYQVVTGNLVGDFEFFEGLDLGNGRFLQPRRTANAYFLDVVTNAPDLTVTSLDVPATGIPGENSTITYTVHNDSIIAATGNWFDALYLSRDDQWDAGDTFIGSVQRTGGLAALGDYTGTYSGPLPGIIEGNYRVIVIADNRGLVADIDRSNNTFASGPIAIDIPVLQFDAPIMASIADGQDRYFRIDVPVGKDVQFVSTFSSTPAAEMYLRYRDAPKLLDSLAATDPAELEHRLLLTAPQEGRYYVLLHGRSTNTFQLTASQLGINVESVTPARGSNQGSTTITIEGGGFTSESAVTLISPTGAERMPTSTVVRDANTIFATFDLQGAAPGVYDVRVSDGALSDVLADIFDVTTGEPGRLEIRIPPPADVRVGRSGLMVLEYENVGETDFEATYLAVNINNGTFVAPDDPTLDAGFSLGVLAVNQEGLPGVLPPGYRGRVLLPFRGGVAGFVRFSAIVFPDSDPFDWLALKDDMRPASIEPAAWDLIFNNYLAEVGTTFGSYRQALIRAANYLSDLGIHTTDVERLQGFLLQQADGFGVISTRFGLGSMGRGQPDPNDLPRAVVQPNGDVSVFFASVERRFLRQQDGTFVAPANDRGTLTTTSTGVRLREINASIIQFNADGLVEFIEDSEQDRTTYEYDSGRLVRIVDRLGEAIEYTYAANGRVTSLTDPLGSTVTFTYDASGEHLVEIDDGVDTITYAYDLSPGPKQHTVTSIEYPDGSHDFFEYDTRGRLSRRFRDGGAHERTYSYNLGAMTETESTGESRTWFLDDRHLTPRMRDGLGQRLDFGFDSFGNVVSILTPDNGRQSFEYDDHGNTVSGTDAQGNRFDAEYDDTFGNLLSYTDARGNRIQYTYDAAGRPISTIFPNGTSTAVQYDMLGRIGTRTDRSNAVTSYSYDARDNVTAINGPGASDYALAYDARDSITSITDAAGDTTYTYDSLGRVTQITYPNGRFVRYEYDDISRRSRLLTHDGFDIRYVYDTLGRLASLTDGAGIPYVTYEFDSLSRLTAIDYRNGTRTEFEINAVDRISRVTNKAPNDDILSFFDYTYDASGHPAEVATNNGVLRYEHDAVGQLTAVTTPGNRRIVYQYDAVGNRVSVTDAGITDNVVVNNLNQYTSVGATTFTYDGNGNLGSRTDASGTTTYAYDGLGRLTSIDSPTDDFQFEYDFRGNRTAAIRNGVRTEYLVDPVGLGVVIGEYDSLGNSLANFVNGYGLAARVTDAADSYYGFDGAGNTVQLTDDSGAVVNSYEYLPFGESLQSTESVPNPFTFAGQIGIMGQAGGLYWMRNRWYDPALGRFLSPDPIGLAGGSLNFYAYTDNSPLSGVDGDGLDQTFLFEVMEALGENGRGLHEFPELDRINNNSLGPKTNLNNPASIDIAKKTIPMAVAQLEADIALLEGKLAAGSLDSKDAQLVTDAIDDAKRHLADHRGELQRIADFEASTKPAPRAGTTATTGTTTANTGVNQTTGNFLSRSRQFLTQPVGNVGTAVGRVGGGVATALPIALDPSIGFFFGANNPDPNSINPFGDKAVKKGATSDVSIVVGQAGEQALNKFIDNLVNLTTFGQIRTAIRTFQDLAGVTTGNTRRIQARDPNEISGPTGTGAEGFVPPTTILPYTILFENLPAATAAAQTVIITHQLDADLDLSTFELADFGFGDTRVSVPPGRTSYQTRVDAIAATGLFVDVSAELDFASGLVTWTFTSIDPVTLDITADVHAGFLPPNVNDGDGEGFVHFFVRPKTGLVTGTQIDAQARIIFDENEPIDTNVHRNTIDRGEPASQVEPLPPTQSNTAIDVSWTGQDDAGGSGIAGYSVFVSDNGGPFAFLASTDGPSSTTFQGEVGHTYSFFTRAVDGVGHVEPEPLDPDAVVQIVDDADSPTVVDVRVRGSGWTSPPFSIPVGSGGQLAPLPWVNVDQIQLIFSEDVTVDIADLALTGSAVTNNAFSSFQYNQSNFTATWILSAPLTADALRIDLDADGPDGVTDLTGNALDGEWDNPADTADLMSDSFPSGDGSAGGDFLFRFNTLSGDTDGNRIVNVIDLLLARLRVGASVGSTGYSRVHDVDANDRIDVFDPLLIRLRVGQSLPADQMLRSATRMAATIELPAAPRRDEQYRRRVRSRPTYLTAERLDDFFRQKPWSL